MTGQVFVFVLLLIHSSNYEHIHRVCAEILLEISLRLHPFGSHWQICLGALVFMTRYFLFHLLNIHFYYCYE